MVRKIVINNRKGGVGKTTVASHLASGLTLAGYNVCIVDTDPQGHVAVAFGMKKESGLYHILCDEDATFEDVVRQVDPVRYSPPGHVPHTPLYILPGMKNTVSIVNENMNPFAFDQMLNALAERYNLDFIIVDTGPTASLFDGSVFLAAHYFLYVSEMANLSFDGLRESLKDLRKLNLQNKQYRSWETQLMGVIPNKTRFQTISQRAQAEILGKNKDFHGLIWEPIKLGSVWEDAMNRGQMVYSYAPDGVEAAKAYRLVQHVLETVGAHES